MESYKLAVKFFIEDASALAGHEFVPVFHSWIQQHKLPNHLLIDVADYQHVHQGPGTMLISLEANFAMDKAGGHLGLLYTRKLAIPGANTFVDRLYAVLRPALQAVRLLEQEPKLAGRIKFRTDEWLFRINDRLLGPNTAETFAAVKPGLETVVAELYGSPSTVLEYHPSADSLFEVRIKPQGPVPLSALLDRLPTPAQV